MHENKFVENADKLFDFLASKEGVKILDKELVSKQRSILGHVLKQMGANLFSGKSLMSVSFPIDIFEGQSMLQRIAKSLAYAPHFLFKAGEPEGNSSEDQLLN